MYAQSGWCGLKITPTEVVVDGLYQNKTTHAARVPGDADDYRRTDPAAWVLVILSVFQYKSVQRTFYRVFRGQWSGLWGIKSGGHGLITEGAWHHAIHTVAAGCRSVATQKRVTKCKLTGIHGHLSIGHKRRRPTNQPTQWWLGNYLSLRPLLGYKLPWLGGM